MIIFIVLRRHCQILHTFGIENTPTVPKKTTAAATGAAIDDKDDAEARRQDAPLKEEAKDNEEVGVNDCPTLIHFHPLYYEICCL